MNDAQRDVLYSKEAAETFGTEIPPERVRTQKKDRRRHETLKLPTMLEQQKEEEEKVGLAAIPKNSVSAKTIISDTANTCMQACTGAVYDFWNWDQLPGKASTKMHTIATRGGRGPYLLLTFVTFVVVVFCLAVVIRNMTRGTTVPKTRFVPYNNIPPAATIGPTMPAPRGPPVQNMIQRVPVGTSLVGASPFDNSVLRLAPTGVYKYA